MKILHHTQGELEKLHQTQQLTDGLRLLLETNPREELLDLILKLEVEVTNQLKDYEYLIGLPMTCTRLDNSGKSVKFPGHVSKIKGIGGHRGNYSITVEFTYANRDFDYTQLHSLELVEIPQNTAAVSEHDLAAAEELIKFVRDNPFSDNGSVALLFSLIYHLKMPLMYLADRKWFIKYLAGKMIESKVAA